MTLHLIKLCVGVDTVDDLAVWVDHHAAEARRAGKPPRHVHVTRMVPKRAADLLDGGSLYWVIKGNIQVRERLIDIEPFTDKDGIHRCRIVMEPKLIVTDWQPRRPFQGWRYLKAADAPADRKRGSGNSLPAALAAELAELGLR
ncbi:DUF1489 family protein [Bauldia sp.]|uniref:DUF1489 family protein n=1 Tax=Bauldia sp. TaxID=2575872 RepID=UPI003BAD8EC5